MKNTERNVSLPKVFLALAVVASAGLLPADANADAGTNPFARCFTGNLAYRARCIAVVGAGTCYANSQSCLQNLGRAAYCARNPTACQNEIAREGRLPVPPPAPNSQPSPPSRNP